MITTLGGFPHEIPNKKRKRKFATVSFMVSVLNVVRIDAMQTLGERAISDHSFVSFLCNVLSTFERKSSWFCRNFYKPLRGGLQRIQILKLNERKLSYVVLHEMGEQRSG